MNKYGEPNFRPDSRAKSSVSATVETIEVVAKTKSPEVKIGRVKAERAKAIPRNLSQEKLDRQSVNTYLEKIAYDHDGIRESAKEALVDHFGLETEQIVYVGSVYDSENPNRPNPSVFARFQDASGKAVQGFVEIDSQTHKFSKFINY